MTRRRVVDTSADAESMRKTFMDRPHTRHTELPFEWPESMQEIGVGHAVMYRSNKWKKNPSQTEDYKHIAESKQTVYVTPKFLRTWENPNKPIEVHGPMVELERPMPKHFAVLAPLLGFQLQLNGPDGKPDPDGYYEVTVAHGMVGGAIHPETGEPFLFIYTRTDGVHMLLTGEELDVEKDGIVG